MTPEIKTALATLAHEDFETMKGWDAATMALAKGADAQLSKPEERKAMSEAFKKNFEEADEDQDKYLNQAEYSSFCAKMKAYYGEKNLPVIAQSEDYLARCWTVMNKVNNSYEGVAPADIGICKNYMNTLMNQLRRKQATRSEAKSQ